MKNKEKIVHLLCQASNLLSTKDEQQAIINLAVNFGFIYGQAVQVDITSKDLKFTGVTFAERGLGIVIANALSDEVKKNIVPVTESKRVF